MRSHRGPVRRYGIPRETRYDVQYSMTLVWQGRRMLVTPSSQVRGKSQESIVKTIEELDDLSFVKSQRE